MDQKGKATAPPENPPPMSRALPKRPPLTHFLCIPLVTPASRPELSASLASFRRETASANERCFRIPDGAVRPLGTLHLTLGVMSLKEEKLGEAVGLLRGLRMGEILGEARREEAERSRAAARRVGGPEGGPAVAEEGMSISLRGLQSMQKASQASVLYAPPVDARGTLRPFCEKLRGKFLEAGLMVDDDRPLLLHATVVNTVYVRGRGRGKGKRLTLDAGSLLDRYADYVWLERFAVDRVAICRMGAKELEGEEGEVDAAYEVEAEVRI